MYAIRNEEGQEVGYVGNIVGPVGVELHPRFTPGDGGCPTIRCFDAALRRELSDILPGGNHPIVFTRRDDPSFGEVRHRALD